MSVATVHKEAFREKSTGILRAWVKTVCTIYEMQISAQRVNARFVFYYCNIAFGLLIDV